MVSIFMPMHLLSVQLFPLKWSPQYWFGTTTIQPGSAGQQRGAAVSQEMATRLEAVRPAVVELAALERQAQTSFFALQQRWGAVVR